MKTHLPLVISACIAITLTGFFIEWENQNDLADVDYLWYNDLPGILVIAAVVTVFVYGFYLLANRLIARFFKYKSHEFTNYFHS